LEVAMRPLGVMVAVGWVLLASARVHGQDSARAIIEKAIQAQGGEKQVVKLRIMRIKVEGMIHDPVQGKVAFVIENTWQLPGQYKSVHRIQLKKDMAAEHAIVIDGGKGWTLRNGKLREVSEAGLARYRDQKPGAFLHPLGFLNEKVREL